MWVCVCSSLLFDICSHVDGALRSMGAACVILLRLWLIVLIVTGLVSFTVVVLASCDLIVESMILYVGGSASLANVACRDSALSLIDVDWPCLRCAS